MDSLIWLAPALAVVALLFAFYKISFVSKQDAGTDRMKEISSAISDGARAFLFAEYRILAIFVAVLFIAIGFGLNSWNRCLLPVRRSILHSRRLCRHECRHQGKCPHRKRCP